MKTARGAIETEYAGHLFRSRIEARWAIFFDMLRIEWLYEPEGFELGEDRWLPDFLLPKTGTWVEVKGTNEPIDEEYRYKLARLIDWMSPLPHMTESWGGTGGLLLLGPIPPKTTQAIAHAIVQHHKGLVLEYAEFKPGGLETTCREYDVSCAYGDGLPRQAEWKAQGFSWPINARVAHAYDRARQAKFEHGETPRGIYE